MAPERIGQIPNPVSVIVLAGGASSRMGFDKASSTVGDIALVSRVTRAAAHLGPVTIVGGDQDLARLAREETGAEVAHIEDRNPGSGPFAALVDALEVVGTAEALVLSCDLAWLTSAEVDVLVAARRAGDSDIALPLVGGRRQWHGVVFDTRIAQKLRTLQDSEVRSLTRGFGTCSQTLVCMSSPTFFADVDTADQLADVREELGN